MHTRMSRRFHRRTWPQFHSQMALNNRPNCETGNRYGKPPTEVLITAETPSADWARGMYVEGQGYPDPKWQSDVARFKKMFALTTLPPTTSETNFGFNVDFKSEADLEQLVADGAGDKACDPSSRARRFNLNLVDSRRETQH
jgi:hypothetical protein